MNAKLPAPLQQKVPAHAVKSLLEVNKHNKQWLRIMLCRVYEVLEGENSIKGAVAIHSFIHVTPVAEAHLSNASPFQTPLITPNNKLIKPTNKDNFLPG
jgi:hypothetical protein